MRRALAAFAATALSLSLTPPAGAQKAPSASELRRAQTRANEAASRLAGAQTALARAEAEVARLEARTSASRARLSELEGAVRQLAVHQYVQGGEPMLWLSHGELEDAVRSRAMLRFVTVGQTDAVGEYRLVRSDLEEGRAALEQRLKKQRSAVARLRQDGDRATGELSRLAAAQRAYEAQQAEAERRAAAERAAATRARRPPPTVRAPLGLPAPLPAGGTRVIGSGQWICPVQGPRAFSNDWGQPRSGGRRHQGNDILAPRGTPVVANVGGNVRPHNSGMGGISYYLSGTDGNTYFGTHLDRLSGASGRVGAGTVIGYVGNSGNARGGPTHLHFEIHPGGGGPVNPYPTVSRYC